MTNFPADVRLALPGDEDAIVSLLRAKHAEDGFGSFDETKVRDTVRRGIGRDKARIGVVRGRGVVEASVGLYIGAMWYAREPDEYVYDLWHYVGAPYRRSDHAKHLIEFAKRTAEALSRPLMMSMLTNEVTANKEKLLERQLPRRGSIFIYEAAEKAVA